MDDHTIVLKTLAEDLFTLAEFDHLQAIASISPLDLAKIAAFDQAIRGPCMLALTEEDQRQYVSADRDAFRPLQYCAWFFEQIDKEWLLRGIVQMSCLHIESMIKRIGFAPRLSLGTALRKALVRQVLDPVTWKQIYVFTGIYNDAKHKFDHPKDTHLFSIKDAVLAYFVGRYLGMRLYPHARIETDMTVFEKA